MTNLERLINGESIEHKPIQRPTQQEMYLYMHELGKKRFGSECKHEQVKGNHCTTCLRKVVTKL